jgi:hypothetical protein
LNKKSKDSISLSSFSDILPSLFGQFNTGITMKRRYSDRRAKVKEAPASPPQSTSTPLEEEITAFFVSKSLLKSIHSADDGLSSSYMYRISDAYNEIEPRWVDNLRVERFDIAVVDGLLYRPQIVDEIIQKTEANLTSRLPKGLFVKGPQNIGKSFSLVNTVVSLETSGKFLVTFIPDCEKWNTWYDLVNAIFQSFGSTPNAFGHSRTSIEAMGTAVQDIIDEIDLILTRLHKKWIFVFDQINKIFNKPECSASKGKVGDFPFPFKMMKTVMKATRITSIISASANNEAAYSDYHEGFVEYNHKTEMDTHEVENTFPSTLHRCDIETLMELTGGVPGYAHLLLNIYNGNIDDFEEKIGNQLRKSLDNLQINCTNDAWKQIKETIFSMLLGYKTNYYEYYDRQFFIQQKISRDTYEYHALIPVIMTYCKRFFYEDLLMTVKKSERALLSICSKQGIPQSVIGFLFEAMVVNRFLSNDIRFVLTEEGKEFTFSADESRSSKIANNKFPNTYIDDGVYIPASETFPAVDMILKKDKTIVGVQIHTSKKDKKDITKFEKRAKAAGWFQTYEEVYLMFLSPDAVVTSNIQSIITKNSFRGYTVIALDIASVQGL